METQEEFPRLKWMNLRTSDSKRETARAERAGIRYVCQIQEGMSDTILTQDRQERKDPDDRGCIKASNTWLRTTVHVQTKGSHRKYFLSELCLEQALGLGREVELLTRVNIFQLLVWFLLLHYSELFWLLSLLFPWAECPEFLSGCWCRGGCLETVAMVTISLILILTWFSHLLVFCLWPLERNISAGNLEEKRGSCLTQRKDI